MEAKDTYGYWCSYYLGVWLVSLLDNWFLFFYTSRTSKSLHHPEIYPNKEGDTWKLDEESIREIKLYRYTTINYSR